MKLLSRAVCKFGLFASLGRWFHPPTTTIAMQVERLQREKAREEYRNRGISESEDLGGEWGASLEERSPHEGSE